MISSGPSARLNVLLAAFAAIAIALAFALVISDRSEAGAQSTPDRPLLCFMVQGNNDRTLAVVPDAGDGATTYDVATNFNPANGSFNLVTSLNKGDQLNTKVASVAHWARARNESGPSAWLRCDSYRKTAFIAVEDLVDYRRPGAAVAVGLDGAGQTAVTSTYRTFAGEEDDIVVTDVGNSAGLEPNGKKMAWRARFRLSAENIAMLENSPGGLSWNVMQRGLASDPGGQWKMSVVTTETSEVFVQCVTQDGRSGQSDRQLINSTVDLGSLPITDGFTRWISATCFSDDSGQSQGADGVRGDGLQVVVNGRTEREAVFPAGVGHLIAPSSTATCAAGIDLDDELFPQGIGNVITVGNKPSCDGSPLGDDTFMGQIDFAEVFRQ